jgi:hypothetical protein
MKDPDLTHYKSLGEFFYRELKDGIRPIDESPIVSSVPGGGGESEHVCRMKDPYYLLLAMYRCLRPMVQSYILAQFKVEESSRSRESHTR